MQRHRILTARREASTMLVRIGTQARKHTHIHTRTHARTQVTHTASRKMTPSCHHRIACSTPSRRYPSTRPQIKSDTRSFGDATRDRGAQRGANDHCQRDWGSQLLVVRPPAHTISVVPWRVPPGKASLSPSTSLPQAAGAGRAPQRPLTSQSCPCGRRRCRPI